MLKLNLHRDPELVKHFVRRGMFQDLDRERLFADEPEPQIIEHIHRTSDMGKKEFDTLTQHTRMLDYLMKRTNERTKKQSYTIT